MKIKSITRTNKFVKVPMSVLKDNDEHHIFTPFGWTIVKSFDYIKSGPAKIIKHATDQLVCDYSHVLMIDRIGIRTAARADQLNPSTDKLYSFDDSLVEFDIQDSGENDFYDIEIASPHWWYTSGIVSHNSILLCNNAISSIRGPGLNGEHGQDVLLITFELDVFKTALRCLAATVGISQDQLIDHQDLIRRTVSTIQQTYKKKFYIHEWPPDECSVSHIYALLDNLKRTKGWKPDVIIIDYLDLMTSRHKEYNADDYTRQKHVATEVRGLATNENVLIFTATQTNRGGMDGDKLIDLNKTAESFGKQFPLDYIISLNQSMDERNIKPTAQLRFFVAKNRNGPKHQTITCEIDYKTMVVRELKSQPIMIDNHQVDNNAQK